MSVFPFMQKIDGKRFLVIGAGAVARRKVRLLLQFTDRITVITQSLPAQSDQEEKEEKETQEIKVFSKEPEEAEELTAFSNSGVEIIRRTFSPEDLKRADYCIASSDDKKLNSQIAALCLSAGLPVNVPDDPALCTFLMPSVIKRGPLVISVSTEGASPAMSAEIRRRIEDILPDRTEEILDRMAEVRAWLPSHISSSKERGQLYKELLSSLLDGSLEPGEEEVRAAALARAEQRKK